MATSEPPQGQNSGSSSTRNTTTINSTSPHRIRIRNQDLTPEEQQAKRLLKKHLKQRTKAQTLQTKVRHAQQRPDCAILLERALAKQAEYHQQLMNDPQSFLNLNQHQTNDTCDGDCPTGGTANHHGDGREAQEETLHLQATNWIQTIRNRLLQSISLNHASKYGSIDAQQQQREENDPQPKNTTLQKEIELQASRDLLHSMSKGTLTPDMLANNELALIGYTRQKFAERARLVVTSLQRTTLPPLQTSLQGLLFGTTSRKDGRPCKVCSIGSGPGCDALGVLAYLHFCHANGGSDEIERREERRPTTFVLLDFAMSQWKRTVLDTLFPLLQETDVFKASSSSFVTGTCDIRLALDQQPAQDDQSSSSLPARANTRSVMDLLEPTDSVGLIVLSYILTEAREGDGWRPFFDDLLPRLSSGTLILLSEPTAWQQHHFLHTYQKRFIALHQWLDSSRDFPELQNLERRIMGPAVLLIQLA